MADLEDHCGRTLGEFVLRERLDAGGFGAVYRCDQPLLGREAVVKVLHQRLRRDDVALQRFKREAQLASRLDHPYAAHVYAFGIEEDDGLLWIAMELVQGITLNRWLETRGPLSLDQLVPFFDRVAEVVQAAHERGIVHRDLKPSNVMVIERAGRLLPKLLDFGVAKLLDEVALPTPAGASDDRPATDPGYSSDGISAADAQTTATMRMRGTPSRPRRGKHRLTRTDGAIGSPPYMAPEQWTDPVAVGPASDLYALGVVAYEALTGCRPFSAETADEYYDLHHNASVPPLGDGFSPALDQIFQRALAKRPQDRWGSALELVAALRSAAGLSGGTTELPRLDYTVRDSWLAEAPQPLAESVAELDAARNAHQARDAVQDIARNLLRYLLAITLATLLESRDDQGDPALLELMRAARQRDLSVDERARLLRLLLRPLISTRAAHPIPELLDLVTPDADGADALEPIVALHAMTDLPGTDDLVRLRLTQLVPELTRVLRRLAFVRDHAIPSGFTRNDPTVWDSIATRVISAFEAKARMREQLRASAAAWQDRARPEGLLWRGDAFADLERWTRKTAALSELEASFVAASRRYVRRSVWIRRLLIALAVCAVLGGFEYRSMLQSRMADQLVTQAEVEQGRQALIHDDSEEARQHLMEAHRRGERSSSLDFMLARALQSIKAEVARFGSSSGRMWSAAFSPDGKQIVATDDQAARVWDAQTHQLLFTLSHGDTVFHSVYSTDGQRLVTAGGDGVVRLWNAATGTLLRELTYERHDRKHSRYLIVAMSPDGKLVAAIDMTGEMTHVWDACTGAPLVELRNEASDVPALAFSPDGRWLATSGGVDVRVFETTTWEQALAIAGPQVLTLSFDPTGPRLATGTFGGDAALWAIPSGERIFHLREIGEPIDAIAFSPNGQLLATASRDGAEQIWNTRSRRLQNQINYLHSKIQSIEFDATSELVLAAGASGTVVVADAALGMPVAVLEGPRNVVKVAHFDPSSHRVLGASSDGTVRVWDATSPYRRWSSPPISDGCGLVTGPEPDRRFVAIGCGNHETRIWDTAHDQLLAELPSVTHVDGDFLSVFPAVSATGDRAAIARGKMVEIYALPGGQLVRTITHGAAVNAVAFAASGHDLVSGDIDGALIVTRDSHEPLALSASPGGIDTAGFLADGRVVATDAHSRLRIYDTGGGIVALLPVPTRVMSVRPSPDGLRLITIPSYAGKSVPPGLWDLEHYRLIASLEGHVGRVFSARFAGNSEIVTAGGDGAVRRWDGATGQLRQIYRGSSRFLADAMLYPDGSMVVAGGGDGLLRFWDASSGRLLWTVQAHKSFVIGIHFEGDDIVTRGFGGDVARWTLPTLDSVIEACTACDIGTSQREFGIVQP